MVVRLTAVVIALLFFSIQDVNSAEPFEMITDGHMVKIRTGAFTAATSPDLLTFSMNSVQGNVSAILGGYGQTKLKSIEIEKSNPDCLIANLLSVIMDEKGVTPKRQFSLRLEIRRNDPCLRIRSGVRNLGKTKAILYFFWMLSPMRSDVYVLPDGEFKVNSRYSCHKAPWVFLPHDNHYGGTGLIFDHQDDKLKFGTNYPDNSGWYLMRNAGQTAKTILPGEVNNIDFILFPALNEQKVAAQASKIRAEGYFRKDSNDSVKFNMERNAKLNSNSSSTRK